MTYRRFEINFVTFLFVPQQSCTSKENVESYLGAKRWKQLVEWGGGHFRRENVSCNLQFLNACL